MSRSKIKLMQDGKYNYKKVVNGREDLWGELVL